MPDHEHDFGPVGDRLTAAMCRDPDCVEWGVSTGKRWREPTSAESVSLALRMIEDVAMADALVMIHGRERGLAKARFLLYGDMDAGRSLGYTRPPLISL